MSLTLPRPRDRMWTAASTWKGFGEHGQGEEEEGIDDDCLDAFDDSIDRLHDSVDDEVVDQGVEEKQLEGLHRRRRR